MTQADFEDSSGFRMGVSKKVLIVDDEEIFAENLQKYFQRCGWDTRLACNGKEAMIVADEFHPGLILLDYHLPDMNGLQALDAIRAGNHCCGCVLMTGHPSESVLAGARRRGVERVLCKPFSMAGLESHLTAAIAEFSPPPSN